MSVDLLEFMCTTTYNAEGTIKVNDAGSWGVVGSNDYSRLGYSAPLLCSTFDALTAQSNDHLKETLLTYAL